MALEDWLKVAQTGSDDDVREWILTGVKAGKPFTPYVPTLDLPPALSSVLDFGCGLGRNFPYLTSIAARVTGFDLPPMIARCRQVTPAGGPRLSDDWDRLRGESFDLIFASLVLQHVETSALERYLEDFARMAPVTYLLTRADSDFGTNVLAVIDRLGLFAAGHCVEVEHDERTHQLRVMRTVPLTGAARPGNTSHYEVLLRSRR